MLIVVPIAKHFSSSIYTFFFFGGGGSNFPSFELPSFIVSEFLPTLNKNKQFVINGSPRYIKGRVQNNDPANYPMDFWAISSLAPFPLQIRANFAQNLWGPSPLLRNVQKILKG